MKRITLTVISLAALCQPAFSQWAVREEFPNHTGQGVRFEHFSKEQWDASNFATPDAMKVWQDRRYGMFIHFGITSKSKKDLSWGSISQRYAPDTPSIMANGQKRTEEWTTWPKDMTLEKFNAKEWVEIAQRAGFKYIVVCTKHHEGFHMWDTAFSDFKITNTPFGRDYIKELVDACHAAGMPIGFYFAQREWYHPDYQPVDLNHPGKPGPLHPKYLEYLRNVVRELCTKYGKIDIWWWDAVTWNGMFNKEMWDSENLTRLIRELQPGIAINNRAFLPGDYDTPEGILGAFQDWRPWESCIPLSDAWCYTGSPAHSFDHILHLVVGAACGNGNLLLSWGPHWSGEYDAAQKQRLFEIGDWLKENGESIYGTRGGPWKPTGWGGSTRRGKTAYVHLFKRPTGNLVLPAIPGRQVVTAKMLISGESVSFKQTATQLVLTIPGTETVKGDLVVALTMDKTLDGLPSIAADQFSSAFATDPSTYGHIISRQAKVTASSVQLGALQALIAETPAADFAFHTAAEANPWVEIDLGREVSVTGVRILNRVGAGQPGQDRAATLRLSVSSDGKSWVEVWKADHGLPAWEIPITDFVSGAQIPGRKARYLQLKLKPAKPEYLHLRQVEVWGKE